MNGEFYLPRKYQGQAVEVWYASVEGWVIRKWYDRSDGETRYAISKALVDDEGDYWNGAPKNKRWRTISDSEAERLVKGYER